MYGQADLEELRLLYALVLFVGRLRSLARLYGSIRIHFSVSSHVSLLPDPYVLAGLNLHYDLLA